MITVVDVSQTAAQPWQPLAEFSAFVNSPSQVRVTGVPSAIGNWRITKLYASVAYPDNTLHTIELVPGGVAPESQPQSTGDTGGGSGASPQIQNSSVSPALCGQNTPLTATLPASTSPGSNPKGFQILADGIDESGNIVTGYALGVGPLTIMPRDGIIVVGDTRYYFHLVDTLPANPKTGDACIIDGVLKWYNGTSWQPFGGAQIVAPSTDPEDAGKAADAYATGNALAGKLSKSEAEAGFTEWSVSLDGYEAVWDAESDPPSWYLRNDAYGEEYAPEAPNRFDKRATSLEVLTPSITATRTRLPTMADIPAASTAAPQMNGTASAGSSAAFARGDHVHPKDTSKQDALSAAQLANIAAVPNKADASKCKYSFNTATVTLSTTTDTNDTAAVTGIVDHTKNAATLVSTVTAATITIPARTDGYTGDLFLSLTVEGSAPSITFTDAATSDDLDIIFGEDQLADINTGRNLILFSEVKSGKWKVAVEHEDFPEVTP